MSKERKFKLTRRDFLIGVGAGVFLYLFAKAGWETNQKKNTQNYIEQAVKDQGVILFSKIKLKYIEFLAKDNEKIKFLLNQLKAAQAAKDYQALQEEIQIQLAIEVASVITWQERREKISFRAKEIVLVPFCQNPNNPEFRILRETIIFPSQKICPLIGNISPGEIAIFPPGNPLLPTTATFAAVGEQNFKKIAGNQRLILRFPIPTYEDNPPFFVPLSPSRPQEEELLHELISKSSYPIWHATVIIPSSQ